MSLLRIPLGELTERHGVRHPCRRQVQLEVSPVAGSQVAEGAPVAVDLEIEAIAGGVVVAGTVTFDWVGVCRRCLDPVASSAEVVVREIFESRPTEGETYPLGSGFLDLEPMVRDAVTLGLPLAPICRPDCPGPDPRRFPTGTAEGEPADEVERDPRWAALDVLRDADGG